MKMKRTIKEIKELLTTITEPNDPFIKECIEDERKGVQTALKQWFKQREAQQVLVERSKQMNRYEEQAIAQGYQFIAGIDEVGRGPLAGPVVAAAVILDQNRPILGLDDSKKLSLAKRTALYGEIKEKAIAIGIGIVEAAEIDRYNILQATKMAMNQAVNKLQVPADFLLIDAVPLQNGLPSEVIIKGDMNSNSIAAASIIAKVYRDNLMEKYDKLYPNYGFSKNAGYGTKEHLQALETQGVTPIHRKSFSPVNKFI